MNPDALHTGRAETAQGWRYRMIYLDVALLEALTGERGWWFADPVGHDTAAAQRVSRLLAAMWCSDDALALDGALLDLLETIRPHARGMRPPEPVRASDAALGRALQLMHEQLDAPLTLERLASEAQLSPFHFQRCFKARRHASPHQVLMALRLFRAKQRLAAGAAPALVAAEVGLTDQAHLTRRFARMFGVTPARYQMQLGLKAAARG